MCVKKGCAFVFAFFRVHPGARGELPGFLFLSSCFPRCWPFVFFLFLFFPFLIIASSLVRAWTRSCACSPQGIKFSLLFSPSVSRPNLTRVLSHMPSAARAVFFVCCMRCVWPVFLPWFVWFCLLVFGWSGTTNDRSVEVQRLLTSKVKEAQFSNR